MKRTDDLTWVLKKSEWNYQIQVPNCFAVQKSEGHWSFWNPGITPCATNPGNLADPTQTPATRQKTRGLLRIVCRKFLIFSILTRRWYIPILQQTLGLELLAPGKFLVEHCRLCQCSLTTCGILAYLEERQTSAATPRLQMVPWTNGSTFWSFLNNIGTQRNWVKFAKSTFKFWISYFVSVLLLLFFTFFSFKMVML